MFVAHRGRIVLLGGILGAAGWQRSHGFDQAGDDVVAAADLFGSAGELRPQEIDLGFKPGNHHSLIVDSGLDAVWTNVRLGPDHGPAPVRLVSSELPALNALPYRVN